MTHTVGANADFMVEATNTTGHSADTVLKATLSAGNVAGGESNANAPETGAYTTHCDYNTIPPTTVVQGGNALNRVKYSESACSLRSSRGTLSSRLPPQTP